MKFVPKTKTVKLSYQIEVYPKQDNLVVKAEDLCAPIKRAIKECCASIIDIVYESDVVCIYCNTEEEVGINEAGEPFCCDRAVADYQKFKKEQIMSEVQFIPVPRGMESFNEGGIKDSIWERRNSVAKQYLPTEIVERLKALPGEIATAETEIKLFRMSLEALAEDMSLLEADIAFDISNEKLDGSRLPLGTEQQRNGKPKFSNESARKTELLRRLANNEAYQELKLQHKNRKVGVGGKEIRHNELKHELKITNSLAAMFSAELSAI